jgi:hypothetical protein
MEEWPQIKAPRTEVLRDDYGYAGVEEGAAGA